MKYLRQRETVVVLHIPPIFCKRGRRQPFRSAGENQEVTIAVLRLRARLKKWRRMRKGLGEDNA